jgi:hypothetical protein
VQSLDKQLCRKYSVMTLDKQLCRKYSVQSPDKQLCRKYSVQSLDKHLCRKYSVQSLEKQLRREVAVNVKIANAEHPYIPERKKIITLPFFLSKCKSFCCKNHRLSTKQVYGAFLRQQKQNSSGKAVLRPPENVYSLIYL